MRKVVEDKDPHNGYYGFGSHTAPKFIWAIANAICFVSLVLQVFSIYTPDWRVSQPISKFRANFVRFCSIQLYAFGEPSAPRCGTNTLRVADHYIRQWRQYPTVGG